MITKHSLTPEWLTEKRKVYKKSDPSIMERVIFALHLLEEIAKTDLQFIFKGGTSLLLLMDQPARFSIDIDIIVPNSITRENLEKELAKIIGNSVFKSMKLDERRSYNSEIPKAHYIFIYDSAATSKEQEILLDILFEENSYPTLVQRPVRCEWTHHEEAPLTVTTPDIHSITGDKLTAYAPNTIGVLYGKSKEKEIIKQLFDVGTLFDYITDIEMVKASFIPIAEKEIRYRAIDKAITITDILNDIIETGLLLARRDPQPDAVSKANMAELQTGISQFGAFVYKDVFRIEHAQLASAKAAYLSAMIKTGYTGVVKKHTAQTTKELITHPDYIFLNKKLKFAPAGTLFYWVETFKLLHP
jgi:hypothetical protein